MQINGRTQGVSPDYIGQVSGKYGNFTIRIDDANNPGMWLEVAFSINELYRLAQAGIKPCDDLYKPGRDAVEDVNHAPHQWLIDHYGKPGETYEQIVERLLASQKALVPRRTAEINGNYVSPEELERHRQRVIAQWGMPGETYQQVLDRMAGPKPCGEIPLGEWQPGVKLEFSPELDMNLVREMTEAMLAEDALTVDLGNGARLEEIERVRNNPPEVLIADDCTINGKPMTPGQIAHLRETYGVEGSITGFHKPTTISRLLVLDDTDGKLGLRQDEWPEKLKPDPGYLTWVEFEGRIKDPATENFLEQSRIAADRMNALVNNTGYLRRAFRVGENVDWVKEAETAGFVVPTHDKDGAIIGHMRRSAYAQHMLDGRPHQAAAYIKPVDSEQALLALKKKREFKEAMFGQLYGRTKSVSFGTPVKLTCVKPHDLQDDPNFTLVDGAFRQRALGHFDRKDLRDIRRANPPTMQSDLAHLRQSDHDRQLDAEDEKQKDS